MIQQSPTSYNYLNALSSPTSFGGFQNTLAELRLSDLSNEALLNALPSPILDIGSGYEEFAIGLNAIASMVGRETTVISLNPQVIKPEFTDDELARRKQIDIHEEILERVEEAPAMTDYLRIHRKAVSGLVEQLPIRSESIQTVVSTWTYPEFWFEMFRLDWTHEAPLKEIHRVLKDGGNAFLGPIADDYKQQTMRTIIDGIDFGQHPFDVDFIPDDGRRGKFFANHRLLVLRKR